MSNSSNIFLDTLFESVPNAIQVLETVRNQQGEIVDFKYLIVNGQMHQGRLLSEHHEIKKAGLFEQLAKVAETSEPFDKILHFPDGEHDTRYHLRAQKLNDLIIVSREEMTDSRHADDKLMQLNHALFAKNRELEAISSELKTFNTIAANDYSETLRGLYTSMEFIITNDARNLSDAGKANLRRAQAAIQKLKLLTEDIIAFSKITTDEPLSPVNLNEIIRRVEEKMQQKISENLAVITYKDLPVIYGYPLLVTILFTHLIDNAIKFRKADLAPTVTISYSRAAGNTIENSSANKDLQYDVISIVDNGIGFDQKEGEKIFTMFYRLHEKGKSKGSGIGLAICKKIMDLHNGFIASECTPECTTFRCYFPVQI